MGFTKCLPCLKGGGPLAVEGYYKTVFTPSNSDLSGYLILAGMKILNTEKPLFCRALTEKRLFLLHNVIKLVIAGAVFYVAVLLHTFF